MTWKAQNKMLKSDLDLEKSMTVYQGIEQMRT